MNRLNMLFRGGLWVAVMTLGSAAVQARPPQPAAEGWSRWTVPLQPGMSAPCCIDVSAAGKELRRGCKLDDQGISVHSSRSEPSAQQDQPERLQVYVQQRGGKLLAVRSFGSQCPVSSEAPVITLADPASADSVRFLHGLLTAGERPQAEEVLVAIAFHADPAATAALSDATADTQPRRIRESALFWLGQARGQDGLARVDQVAAGDASSRMREHAFFVLSQSDLPEARAALRRYSASDADSAVRAQGLFWLAQVGDAQARIIGLAALRDQAQSSAHEQIVFALSQLPTGEGEDVLIAVVEGDYPRAVKKRALFWLGQSGSDKALRFLDRILAAAG